MAQRGLGRILAIWLFASGAVAMPLAGASAAETAAIQLSLLKLPSDGARVSDLRPDTDDDPVTAEAWFWRRVSTDLGAADPARWPEIVRRMERSAVAGKALYNARNKAFWVLYSYGPALKRIAARHHLSVPLLAAMIAVESGGDPRAVSRAGARGLMQLMPATAARFGVNDSFRPGDNMRGGAAYLDWLLREFDEDVVLALAAYNAGENAVKRNGGVPNYRETRSYVVRVAEAFAQARRFCAEPAGSARSPCQLY